MYFITNIWVGCLMAVGSFFAEKCFYAAGGRCPEKTGQPGRRTRPKSPGRLGHISRFFRKFSMTHISIYPVTDNWQNRKTRNQSVFPLYIIHYSFIFLVLKSVVNLSFYIKSARYQARNFLKICLKKDRTDLRSVITSLLPEISSLYSGIIVGVLTTAYVISGFG